MITITRKFDLLFNKISEMFGKTAEGTYYNVSTTIIKKINFYSNNGITTVRFTIKLEEYETYTLYAILLQKEDNGQLNFQFYYSDKDDSKLCKLKQSVVLELYRIFTS